MPLLKKKEFQRVTLPDLIDDNEEVFYCGVTAEIFRDYEQFCDRIILCNSMVWTCNMTGKSNLTFAEALESEKAAKSSLKDFPAELRKPILFLANRTLRSAIGDMAEDIFSFIKDRYFVGETVEASFYSNKWRESHILHVIAPNEKETKNGNLGKHIQPPASLYQYEVEQLDADDEDISEIMIVKSDQIRRKKGAYTKDKNKLFLKQFTVLNSYGIWTIKQSALDDFGINKLNFNQIFDGPLPDFTSFKKPAKVANGKKVRQETLMDFLSKNGTNTETSNKDLLEKMRQKEKEFNQQKQQKLEEKEAEKQRQKEENIKVATILREWYKPRDDLELEDQKKLPQPTPVILEIKNKFIGDVLMIVEFVDSFSDLLHAKDFFPNGLTLEIMERALTENEVAGPLVDLVHMLLTTIFNFQDEEASQYKTALENISGLKENLLPNSLSLREATKLATQASSWSNTFQGVALGKLPLYPLTISEIVRLHLLASGARINETGAKWRYQQRGGYTSEDDPGLHLRLHQPHILKALALHNMTELPTSDKLKIISCLINQLLTYADLRDVVEDRMEKSKQAKVDLKLLQTAERKREQELAATKLKVKREAKAEGKNATEQLEKLDREAEKRKLANDRKIEKLINSSVNYQVVLGYDRAFRRILKLQSVPGLFVDFDDENVGHCLDNIVHQNSELVDANRDETLQHVRNLYKESLSNGIIPNDGVLIDEIEKCQELLICSADSTNCSVHSIDVRTGKWAFYYKPEQIDELINSLNKRGIREGELREMLQNERDSLLALVSRTPVSQLNSNVGALNTNPKKYSKSRREANMGYPTEMSLSEVLACTLIDNILELEDKINAGNLGSLKIKNRELWREHLSSRKYEDLDKTFIKRNNEKDIEKGKKDGKNSRSNSPEPPEYKDPGRFLGNTVHFESDDSDSDYLILTNTNDQKLTVKTLAIALVQVAQAIDSKYLKKPLGRADLKNNDYKKKIEYDVLERWEQSLLASTSFSQIFIHYGTLDNCVMWSRSALLAKCMICRRPKNSEKLLLCDNCNNGYHMYCLKPKLKSVPKGDWFCNRCRKEKEKERQLQNPVVEEPKKRRRIFQDEDVDDEEDIKSTPKIVVDEDVQPPRTVLNDVSEISDVEKKSDDNKEETCERCLFGGELLCCDKCPALYHLECCEPPLRRIPRGEWKCHNCREKMNGKKDDERRYGNVVQRTGCINNQRRCAAKARHKIHGFIKSLRQRSEFEDCHSDDDHGMQRRSNRRDTDPRDDLPLHNAALQELLADTLKHKDAWPFIRPVTKFEVPDYFEIINQPMDFGTIKYKLNMGKYKCDADLMSDAVLVFDNCNTYNNSEAEVYKCGVQLLKHFVVQARKLGLKLPEEMEDDEKLEPSEVKKRRTK